MKREDAGINRFTEYHRDSIQLPGTQTSAISEHANKNGYHSLWDNWGYSATRKTANTWIISGMFLMLWPITTMIRRYELQWGTKVLRHFPKMAPFCIVGIPIPFPCLPQPLPPKINVVFWTLKSFFYFRQHWLGGWGDLRRLKGMKL